MSLSPAAHGLYADLCLLLRLPLPTFDGIVGADAAAVSIDAVKERVFGATEGPPRTERESVERYILAIVQAFEASGATSIDTFDHDVRRHAALCARMSIVLEEHAAALAALDKAHERIKRLQEINERLETRNREATQAGASFGVETCGLLAEKDAEIARLRSDLASTRAAHATLAKQVDGLTYERDRAVTELEDMRERERIARADAVHCHQEMRALRAQRDQYKALAEQQSTTVAELRGQFGGALATVDELRTDLAATRKHHADLTAAHAKLAADATWRDKHIDLLDKSLANARREAKSAHDALTVEQGRSERLRAVMVDLIADLNAAKEGAE